MQNGASPSALGIASASAAATDAGGLRPGARGPSALISHHSQQSCETLSKRMQN